MIPIVPSNRLPSQEDQQTLMRSDAMQDAFDRPLKTLRVSLTDRCNFRCNYCLPRSHYPGTKFFKKSESLTAGEMIRIIKILSRLGVNKVRLTGGEPLLFPELIALIREIRTIPQIKDLAMTTNGSLLKTLAVELKNAGLMRLTVSLDTLDQKLFSTLRGTRTSLKKILQGITAAQHAGFSPIKINAVIQRQHREPDILALVDFFRGTPHILRFIEIMDTGSTIDWRREDVLASAKIHALIDRYYPLDPLPAQTEGDVARRFQFRDGQGEIGFISSVSEPFCATCNRLRLSSDGKIYTCLFSGEGTDLRAPLRNGASDAELTVIITRVWRSRADKYSENRALFRSLKEKIEKVEMYKIGG